MKYLWILILLISCSKDEDMRMFISSINTIETPTEISGCTDPTAENYNPLATVDDGSCIYPSTFDGGLFISFDDLAPDNWKLYHDNHGVSRNWKATFYITKHSIGLESLYATMKILEDYGHEIGTHGTFNEPSLYLSQGNTELDYYNTYVKPVEDQIVAAGMTKPKTFRFPYSHLSPEIETDLKTNRGYTMITPHYPEPLASPITDTNIFYNFDNYAIAKTYAGGYIESQWDELLDYARDNGLVLCIMGHGISDQDAIKLNHIIDYGTSIGLTMLTASEVVSLTGSIGTNTTAPTIGTLTINSSGLGEFTMSITATDDIQVVGFDIYLNGIYRRTYNGASMSNVSIGFLDAGTYNVTVKARDRHRNTSSFSNEESVTVN